MRKIVAVESLSLDGVMQAPGRADEDLRGGFAHGGWAMAYNDADKGRIMAQGMAQGPELLFGRRTYEDFFAVWPGRQDNPFSALLDATPKYVASRTLVEPLPWKNSILLAGEAAESVARLKRSAGPDLVVLGSGELVRSLLRHELVDELVLLVHPLLLGAGRRLFADDGGLAPYRLVEAPTTGAGVIVASYQRELRYGDAGMGREATR